MSKKTNSPKTSGKKPSKSDLTNKIVSIFSGNPQKNYNYRQIAALLGLTTPAQKQMASDALANLLDQEMLIEPARGKYKFNGRGGIVTGEIDRKKNGKTFLLPDDGGIPVFIAERNINRAVNNDRVKVLLYGHRKGTPPEGEVLEILKRERDSYVGTLEVSESYAFLQVDNKVLLQDIFIPKDKLKGGKNGQKAVARIVEWNDKRKSPLGEIIDILGDTGNNNAEMHAILAEFGLPYKYPEEPAAVAEKLTAGITDEEVAKRIDFRGITTFTIDPKDAKDFDDALSMRKLENGNWEIGIHIADVTHYVHPNDIIDKEGFKRATSVYLVDRTVPMLPEKISNELCSLRPDEDKLAYSVIVEMNEQAELIQYKISRTVIRSVRRFSYEEAQEILETGKGDFCTELLAMNHLAKILRERRFKNGAILFDRAEVRFDIDENGKPLGVYTKMSKDSNNLIEEFMLLANCTVAAHIGKVPKGRKAKTFVYRVHDLPNNEKLERFSNFIKRFGLHFKTTGKNAEISSSINALLEEVKGRNEQDLIETLAIRSMARATYTTANIGHYGLACDYYTHFTSPIRRYPDMMVHRLLNRYDVLGKQSADVHTIEEMCDQCSKMEQMAANAERASIKYKQVEFMKDKVGHEFDGVISGVNEWGIYVEILENKCEGMVAIRDLADDFYYFDEDGYCLLGRRTHKRYGLGDSIKIKVAKANLIKRYLDFVLAE
jgi:ribonuclease R